MIDLLLNRLVRICCDAELGYLSYKKVKTKTNTEKQIETPYKFDKPKKEEKKGL